MHVAILRSIRHLVVILFLSVSIAYSNPGGALLFDVNYSDYVVDYVDSCNITYRIKKKENPKFYFDINTETEVSDIDNVKFYLDKTFSVEKIKSLTNEINDELKQDFGDKFKVDVSLVNREEICGDSFSGFSNLYKVVVAAELSDSVINVLYTSYLGYMVVGDGQLFWNIFVDSGNDEKFYHEAISIVQGMRRK